MVQQPNAIAKLGNSEQPILDPAVRVVYVVLLPRKKKGMYVPRYVIAPPPAATLAAETNSSTLLSTITRVFPSQVRGQATGRNS